MSHSPYFWTTICVLIGTAAYSVLLGGLSRTSVMPKLRHLLGLIAAGIWIWAIVCCTNMIHIRDGFALAIPGMFWACVFFLGAIMATAQEITTVNGCIHLKKGSTLYWILTEWGGLDLSRPRTLCSLSWLGMMAMIVCPIVDIIAFVVMVLIGLIMFLTSGKSMFRYIKEALAIGGPSGHFKIVYWGRVPMIPAIPIAAGGLIWLLVWLTKFPLVITIYEIIGVLVGFVIVAWIISFIASWFYSDGGEIKIRQKQSIPRIVYLQVLQPTGHAIKTGVVTPLIIFFQVVATLKKTVCPPIVVDD